MNIWKICGGGGHMSDTLMVKGSANLKKGHDRGTSPYHHSNVSAPGVFTSIYLLLCPYLINSDAVFWSYYTRFKTNKAKICIHIGLLRPHFCLLHKIFDVTVLAKPFVFHKTLWNFVLAANLPRDVRSNAIIWRNQNKNALTLCVWREASRVHTFGPRVCNVNTAYSCDVFKGSEARKT